MYDLFATISHLQLASRASLISSPTTCMIPQATLQTWSLCESLPAEDSSAMGDPLRFGDE